MRKSIQKPFERNELISELKKEFKRLGTTSYNVYQSKRKNHLPSGHIIRKKLGNISWEDVVQLCGFKPANIQWNKDRMLSLARSKGKRLTFKELDELGLHADAIYNHFGTIENFYNELGWEYEEREFYIDVTNDELLKEYDDLCKDLGSIATIKEIDEFSKYPSELYRSRFGTINEVRKTLGYEYYKDPRTITKEDCMRAMLNIYSKYGRLPYSKLDEKLTMHIRTVLRKFGTTSIKQVWEEVIEEHKRRCE